MMNIIKISAAIALGVMGTQSAQAAELTLEKGTMSLGGSAGISLVAADGATSFAFGANPSFGYFVSDNIQGFSAPYSSGMQTHFLSVLVSVVTMSRTREMKYYRCTCRCHGQWRAIWSVLKRDPVPVE